MSYDSVIRASIKPKKESVFKLSRSYPALIVLLIGIGISLFAWQYVGNRIEIDNRTTFDKATTSVVTRLESGIRENEQILHSVHGLYDNSVQVVRDMFELYGSIPTKSNNSLLSVCYVPYVSQDKKEEFVYYAKSERYYDYAVKPEGNRQLYYPIEYIVPLERNTHRSGFDLATQKEAFQTIKEAKAKKGDIVASQFYSVRPDTLGFLMMFSVNKRIEDEVAAQLQGSVIEGIVMLELEANNFFARCLGSSAPGDSNIVFSIVQEGEEKNPAYKSSNFSISGTYSPLLSDKHTVSMADKKLIVSFATVPNFGGSFQGFIPLATLIGGIITSFVAAAFLLSVLTSRARAEDLAERMTRSQRRIVEASQDIIAVIGLDGKWKSLSPAVRSVLGYAQEELVGNTFSELLLTPAVVKQYDDIIAHAKDEIGTSFDGQMKNKRGEILWMSWSLTVSHADGLIYAIGRDVTLQKMAEEQIKMKNRQVQLAEQSALEVSEFKSQFMRDLSHGLRNNLTGTMGFIQLIAGKNYDSQDELEFYVQNAETSSEQLYVMVTDIEDITDDSTGSTAVRKTAFSAEKLVNQLRDTCKKDKNKKLSIVQGEDSSAANIFGAENLIVDSVMELVKALSAPLSEATVTINYRPNKYENVVELEMMVSPSDTVADMIELYKKNINNLVDIIPQDQNEIIFHLGIARSMVKRNHGSILVESLGKGEPNICQITYPLAKTSKK